LHRERNQNRCCRTCEFASMEQTTHPVNGGTDVTDYGAGAAGYTEVFGTRH